MAAMPSAEGEASEAPPVTIVIIGAGARGKTYAQYAIEHPDRVRIVGVAEPRAHHRSIVQSRFDLPADAVFSDWTEAAKLPRMADAVVIATQDAMHVDPAVAFASKGYHILLEKPMAVSTRDCKRIAAAAKENDILLCVCHVLRYTPYMRKLVELVRSGAIGDVVNMTHLEPIGSWHFAHSYVRGPWRREDEASFMLMTKCCHDIDLIRHVIGKPCHRVSSFGSLSHFRHDKKPPGAGANCLECGVEPTCPFSARRIYLEPARAGHTGWPVSVVTDGEPAPRDVEEALRTGPYGRCVYDMDNDVCDHQVVSMEFEGGTTATLTTAAFTKKVCQRHTRVFGTRGELEGDGDSEIVWYDFATRTRKTIVTDAAPPTTRMSGHGGADYHLMDAFVRALRTRDPTSVLSGPDETLESHLIVFAAEAARRSGQVLSVPATLEHGLRGAVALARGLDPSPASLPADLAAALGRLEEGPPSEPRAPLGMAVPPSTTAPISAAASVPPSVRHALSTVLTPGTSVRVSTATPTRDMGAGGNSVASAVGAGAFSPLQFGTGRPGEEEEDIDDEFAPAEEAGPPSGEAAAASASSSSSSCAGVP